MTAILVVAAATLLASFTCSLLEAALYSITPARVELLKQRGVRGAERLGNLRRDIEEPIAAILTVNTIAHTVGAAWCGALVAERYGSAAVGAFAAIFTVLVLALTEIVPKSLGVRFAPQLGPFIVGPIRLLIWCSWPVVWVVKHLMRTLGGSREHGPSEEEVVVLARMAALHGTVRKQETRWVQNALELDRVTAKDIRTPRTVLETVDADARVQDLAQRGDSWVHSRVPVVEGDNPDQIIGLVYRREVMDAALLMQTEDLVVRDLLRPIRFVPGDMPANELLDLFLEERRHLVAVADEYGGVHGIVTLEDVLERLLGADIVDEHDEVDNYRELARERSRARAAARAEVADPGDGRQEPPAT